MILIFAAKKVPDIYLNDKPTKTIKVVCISDTHTHYNKPDIIPDGDILVHSGDFSNRGMEEEIEYFNKFLGKCKHKYKIVVPGNHDYTLDKYSPEEVMKKFLPNCTAFLVDKAITIEGITFYGFPWNGHCTLISNVTDLN